MLKDKYNLYEKLKADLRKQHLTPDEYQERLKKIAKELKL